MQNFLRFVVGTCSHKLFLLSTQAMSALFFVLNNVVALQRPGDLQCVNKWPAALSCNPSENTANKHILGKLLSFQHKSGARNDQTLTHVSAERHSGKSAGYRDITAGRSAGAKRQQWEQTAVKVQKVILDPQLSCAAVCFPSVGVLQGGL